MLEVLKTNGWGGKGAPVVLQSFETSNLRDLATKTPLSIAQLVNCGNPYDLKAAGDKRTYADLVTKAGLKDIATYADVVGLRKDVMIPRTSSGALGKPTKVIAHAHQAGLDVHGWTFRAENQFLLTQFRTGSDPIAKGNLAGEIRRFTKAGMDGVFSDQPGLAVATVRS